MSFVCFICFLQGKKKEKVGEDNILNVKHVEVCTGKGCGLMGPKRALKTDHVSTVGFLYGFW